jgi:hypothetical protein
LSGHDQRVSRITFIINYLLFIGCSYGGKCRKPGTVWEDKDTCTKYRCKQENVGTNKVIMHVIEIPGEHSTNCDNLSKLKIYI